MKSANVSSTTPLKKAHESLVSVSHPPLGPRNSLLNQLAEYMISPKLYETLDAEEQKLWHSHVFEVKSGMLIMPRPTGVPEAAWEVAENKEMEEVVELYGKIYHLWQTDRGDKLPLGPPQLMTSYTAADQMPDFEKRVKERDQRFGSDYQRKKGVREYIEVPKIHENADATWAKGGVGH